MTDSPTRAVELQAGALRLAVRPDLGGAMSGLWHHGTEVMRSSEPAALPGARSAASYPLVPYSNRVGHRRFNWDGTPYTTAQNFDDNPHSVHGVTWQRAWDVVSSGPTALVIRYRHAPDAHWPFAFEVAQHFTLTPDAFTVRLVFTNTDARSQPVGLGWHPYFPKRARSRLRIDVTERWESDAVGLPTHRVAQPGIDDAVARLRFDNCFDGWTGAAHIDDEAFSLQLTSSAQHLVVYTPTDKPYYCVEPVTHVSNAVQMADPLAHGLRRAGSGDVVEAEMTLVVKAL